MDDEMYTRIHVFISRCDKPVSVFQELRQKNQQPLPVYREQYGEYSIYTITEFEFECQVGKLITKVHIVAI